MWCYSLETIGLCVRRVVNSARCYRRNVFRLPASRLLLAASSEYFHKMFTLDMKEKTSKEIPFKEVTAVGLQPLVQSCYNGCIELSDENVGEVLAAAHLLRFTKVVEKCAEYLLAELKPANCFSTLELATKFEFAELMETAERLIGKRFMEVCKSNEFHQMEPTQVMKVLGRDNLSVRSEKDVVDAIISWVEWDKANRGEFVPILLKSIRFQHLDVEVRQSDIGTEKVGIHRFLFSRFLHLVKNSLSFTRTCHLKRS